MYHPSIISINIIWNPRKNATLIPGAIRRTLRANIRACQIDEQVRAILPRHRTLATSPARRGRQVLPGTRRVRLQVNAFRSARDWLTSIIRSLPTWAYITAILLLLLLLASWLATFNWDWLRSSGNGPEESNSTTLRNIGLLLGAVVAVILAMWRSYVAERQADAAHSQTAVAQTQATTAQESLRHDRYQRGAAMLGSDLLPVRLAGISALKRLAVDYPEEYHIQIMELFCGFARNPTGNHEDQSWQPVDLEKAARSLSGYREDVQAALTAIGARGELGRSLEAAAGFRVDLRGTDLTHVFLQKADLAGADLHRAKLLAVHAREVNLSGASLVGALLYRMSGVRINLSGADLVGANMTGMRADGTDFSNALLYGADLSEACLSRSNFSGVTLGSNDLTTTQLDEADFSGVNLSETVALTQYQLDNMKWAPGNPPVLANGAIDVTTGKALLLRGGIPRIHHGPEREGP